MKVDIVPHRPEPPQVHLTDFPLFDLLVNGKRVIEAEAYIIVDQVRAALNGETWPTGECREVAEAIRCKFSKR